MKIKTALIIGGGIGGHTLAIALAKAGIEPRLFERAPQLGEVGAGLGVWANAMRVLDRLGVGQKVRKLGSPLRRGEIVSWRGRVLSVLDIEGVTNDLGAGCYLLHRAELLAAIAEAVPAGVARAGMRCVRIEQEGEKVRAHFENGEVAEADVLIGADGLHSVVRASLWGEEPLRYSGQTCYRGIAPLGPLEPQVIRELSGPGLRAAVCPLDARRVYWWAALNAPEGEADVPAERQNYLLDKFRGWPHGIVDFIAATPAASILRNDLVDRAPLPSWSRGRVTLLGDAAHPTTPNLGQGACMAIEDAPVLADALASTSCPATAFRVYETRRLTRTTSVTKASWNFGRLARWQHPAAVWLRETLFRSAPAFLLERSLREQVAEA